MGEAAAASGSLMHRAVFAGEVLREPGQSPDPVIFPIDAVLSCTSVSAEGKVRYVGSVGNEAAFGVPAAFGASILRTIVCQTAGRVVTMRKPDFLKAMGEGHEFASLIRATECARVFALEQLILCGTTHGISQRLAFWLLSTADRTSLDAHAVTHENLSFTLAVRRASITQAVAKLQKADAIECRRGGIIIANRAKLESLSCQCYNDIRRMFENALIFAHTPVLQETSADREQLVQVGY